MVADLACSGDATFHYFCRQSWVRVTSSLIDPQRTGGTLLGHYRPLSYVSFLHGSPWYSDPGGLSGSYIGPGFRLHKAAKKNIQNARKTANRNIPPTILAKIFDENLSFVLFFIVLLRLHP